jgi:hypothetical protein
VINPTELVLGKDGSLSQTKLAAATFHFAIFVTVMYVTFKTGVFNVEMWTLYAAVAVGHSVIDKTTAQVKDFKDAQLAVTNAPVTITTDNQTTTAQTP